MCVCVLFCYLINALLWRKIESSVWLTNGGDGMGFQDKREGEVEGDLGENKVSLFSCNYHSFNVTVIPDHIFDC